jgi:hypothetical protein
VSALTTFALIGFVTFLGGSEWTAHEGWPSLGLKPEPSITLNPKDIAIGYFSPNEDRSLAKSDLIFLSFRQFQCCSNGICPFWRHASAQTQSKDSAGRVAEAELLTIHDARCVPSD